MSAACCFAAGVSACFAGPVAPPHPERTTRPRNMTRPTPDGDDRRPNGCRLRRLVQRRSVKPMRMANQRGRYEHEAVVDPPVPVDPKMAWTAMRLVGPVNGLAHQNVST